MAKVIARSIGRRKTAVARLQLESGKGAIVINNSPLDQYFTRAAHRILLAEPMKMLEIADQYDVKVNVKGGGPTGRRILAGACPDDLQ